MTGGVVGMMVGAKGQTRTADHTIFSRALYQLSYLGGSPGRALGDGSTGGR